MKKRIFLPLFFLFALISYAFATPDDMYYRIQNKNTGGYLCTDMAEDAYEQNTRKYLSLKNAQKNNGKDNLWTVTQTNGTTFDSDAISEEQTITIKNLSQNDLLYIRTANSYATDYATRSFGFPTAIGESNLSSTVENSHDCSKFNIKKMDNSYFVLRISAEENYYKNLSKNEYCVLTDFDSHGYLSTWKYNYVPNIYSTYQGIITKGTPYDGQDEKTHFAFTKCYLGTYTIEIVNEEYATDKSITIDGEVDYAAGEGVEIIHDHPTILPDDVTPHPKEGYFGFVEVDDEQKIIKVTYDQIYALPKDYTDELFKGPSKAFIDKWQEKLDKARKTTYDKWAAQRDEIINALGYKTDKDYYNLPQTGRYLIKNKGTGRYMTNYGELMNIVTPNYYSIWDLVRTDDEANNRVTYTFLNEGTQYVMTPCLDETDERSTGYGHLTYTTGNSRAYECKYDAEKGLNTNSTYTADNTSKASLEFLPDGNGYARWHDVNDPYYACLMTMITENNMVQPTKIFGTENFDQTVQSSTCEKTEEENTIIGTNAFWEVIPLKVYIEEADTEDSGETDYTCEASIFYKAVYDMEHYAGGPVTLDVSDEDHPLGKIKNNFLEKWMEIKDVNVPSNINYAPTHAGYCGEILQAMHDLKTSQTPEYYLSFAENEIVYFCNLDRPSAGARLTYYEDSSSSTKWRTDDSLIDDDTNAKAMWELTATGENEIYYAKNKDNQQYLSSDAGEGYTKLVLSTSDENEAMKLTYIEVVPGIVRLIAKNGNNAKFLSVSGSDTNYGLCRYDNLELSSLWRIKCSNTISLGNSSAEGDDTQMFNNESINFCTFSYFMGTRLYPYGEKQTGTDENGQKITYTPHVKAYYASGTGISADGTKLQITLKPIDAADDKYTYLEKEEGYLIVGFCGNNSEPTKLNNSGCPVMEMTVTSPTNSLYGKNLFTGTNEGEVSIDKNKQKLFFAVANVKNGTLIGTYQGQKVYATGLGFYNLKVGGKIGKNKAYIHSSRFSDYKFVGGKWENTKNSNGIKAKRGQSIEELDGVTCIQLVLQDTEGRETGIIDVDADGNTQYTPYIYDLSGRRVERPGKGIYIVNGEKKLFK